MAFDYQDIFIVQEGVVPIALQKKALRQMLSAKSSPPKALQI